MPWHRECCATRSRLLVGTYPDRRKWKAIHSPEAGARSRFRSRYVWEMRERKAHRPDGSMSIAAHAIFHLPPVMPKGAARTNSENSLYSTAIEIRILVICRA